MKGLLTLLLSFAAVGTAAVAQDSMPFVPPPPVAPAVFFAGTDSYDCDVGRAATTASKLNVFEQNYALDESAPKGKRDWAKLQSNLVESMPAGSPGNNGSVTVDVALSATGSVDAALVECSTDPSLEAAAIQAARQAKYSPTTVEGKPYADIVRTQVWFQKAN